jgi:hypothetical protein
MELGRYLYKTHSSIYGIVVFRNQFTWGEIQQTEITLLVSGNLFYVRSTQTPPYALR